MIHVYKYKAINSKAIQYDISLISYNEGWYMPN